MLFIHSIRVRLSLAFSVLGLLCVAVAAAGLYGMADADQRIERTYRELSLPQQYLAAAYPALLTIALQTYEANQIRDVKASKSQFDVIEHLTPLVNQQIDLFRQSRKPETVRQVTEEFDHTLALCMQGTLEAVDLAKKGDWDASTQTVLVKARPYGIKLAGLINQLTVLLNKEAQREHDEAIRAYERMRAWMLGALVVGGLLCTAFVWWQIRALGNSLGSIEGTLDEVSHSLDLTRRAPQLSNDEIGHTASAFNMFIQRVEQALAGVRGVTAAVHDAAGEIASGNADLSARTEEQAAALERAAARIVDLSTAVEKNADNARKADGLASDASALADRGDAAVQSMVQTIGNISDDAARISDITGLIEGIAFQTNILALNAAVEAARAGEHGRGFAVVAGEVRELAQRASAAAREIKGLIASSTAMVRSGNEQATQVGIIVGQVRQAIRQVFDVVGHIAAATASQNRDIETIRATMSSMDGMTQQNAALSEESAAAARMLAEQADRLKEVVSAFTVTDAATGAVPSRLLLTA
jgi:methyl-accepting chemotaxis protein